MCRLNQDRLRKKQGAKDKLRRLVAPLLGITGASGGKLAFKAFSTIRPRISLRFEGVGVTLRDGTVILEGVNGHFRHSKVRMALHKGYEDVGWCHATPVMHTGHLCPELVCMPGWILPLHSC